MSLEFRVSGFEIGVGSAGRRGAEAAASALTVGSSGSCGPDAKASRVLVLDVRDLHGHFATAAGAHAVLEGVRLELRAGEITALVGPSGAGKSVLARSILRLPEPRFRITGGQILFAGRNHSATRCADAPDARRPAGGSRNPRPETPGAAPGYAPGHHPGQHPAGAGLDLLRVPESTLKRLRGSRLALVFQDARGALNPLATVQGQLDAVCRARGLTGRAARQRQREVLEQAGLALDARLLSSYPHQLSGGTCQRVQLALVLTGDPDVIVLDEPTSQLDVTVQASVAATIRTIVDERRAAVLLIAHDLGLVAGLADRVSIIAAGRIVEEGDVHTIFHSPQHPETRRLLHEARLRSAWLTARAEEGGQLSGLMEKDS